MRTASPPRTDVPVLSRRTLLGGLIGAAAAAPLPTAVAADTELVISIHQTHVALRTSGELGKLPFRVKDWPNISAGPDVIQGLRVRSIGLAANAGIPPIQARAINLDARIVAVQTATTRCTCSRPHPAAPSPAWGTCAAARSPSPRARPRASSCCARSRSRA